VYIRTLLAKLQETEYKKSACKSTGEREREYQNSACKATGDRRNIRTAFVKLKEIA
jgi:hypothetical protein